MAIWNLRAGWDVDMPTAEKLARFGEAMRALADPEQLTIRLTGAAPVESVAARARSSQAEPEKEALSAVAF
jgi:hypothetical protein